MIEAYELRKGNMVLYKNTVGVITQILWNRAEVLLKCNGDVYEETAFEDVEPILVLPELLLKTGFVKHERFPHRDVFHLTEYNFIVNILRDTCEVTFGLDGSVALIRKGFIYLHQLQNLFYALTQRELDVSKI